MSHATHTPPGSFRVLITAFRDEQAVPATAAVLARVFRGRTEQEIEDSLKVLPVLLATDLDLTTAEKLRAHLESQGARVQVDTTSPSTNHSRGIEPPASPPLDPVSTGPGTRPTVYRKVRPGIKDTVYLR